VVKVTFVTAHIFQISRWWVILLPSSMRYVAFHLFLIRSFISSFSVSVVLLGVMSWSRIVCLFLDFHIDHTVMEIRVLSLLESLLRSFSNDSVGDHLIRPIESGGHGCGVHLRQIFLVVSHAWFCLLFSQSSHMCCLDSTFSSLFVFLQKEQSTLSS